MCREAADAFFSKGQPPKFLGARPLASLIPPERCPGFEPHTSHGLVVHSDAGVLDNDLPLGWFRKTRHRDTDLRRVRIIGILHELKYCDAGILDELVTQEEHHPG